MADYIPKFIPGEKLIRAMTGAVTGGQIVTTTGVVAGAGATNWLGVASRDAVAGDRIVVHSEGVQRLVASGAIASGDLVVCAAAGQVSTAAAVTTPTAADVSTTRAIVGIALDSVASGAEVDVKFIR